MINTVTRIFQRYLTPRFVVSLYYFLRFRCLISTKTHIQLSSAITFGRGTVVKPFAVIRTQGGAISVGRRCAIGSFNHISAGIKDIVIGDYVRMGSSVTILGGSRNYSSRDTLIIDQGSSDEGVRIGDDVLIGSNAVILPGCSLGRGCVVGVGSVVRKDVPEYAVVFGVPARIVSHRR